MKMRTRGIYLGVLCCVTYGFAYLCRINLSSALEKMADGFSVPISTIGLFGTLQTLIYAFGQLINGYIISKNKPGAVLLFATAGTAAANILMGLTGHLVPALIIWCANAYVQSLFWTATVRIISAYPESRSDTTVMWTILVLPISYTVSWSVIARALDGVPSWHPYFLIPGLLMLLLIPFWASLGKYCPETDLLQEKAVIRTPAEIFRYIRENRVTLYCVTSVLSGILREGVLFWAPVLLAKILAGTNISPYLTAPIIPFGRIPSTIALRMILPRCRNYRVLSLQMFAAYTLISVLIFLVPEGAYLLTVLLIALLTLLSTMLGSLLSVYVPLSYNDDNMGAPLAGMLDALIYLGGAISTFVLGHILVSDSLNTAVGFWIITAVLGIVVSAVMPKPGHE